MYLKQVILGKRTTKKFKLFLVSKFLEITLIVIFLVTFPLIVFYEDIVLGINISNQINFDKIYQIQTFKSLKNLPQFYDWLQLSIFPILYKKAFRQNTLIKNPVFYQHATSSLDSAKNASLSSGLCFYPDCSEFNIKPVITLQKRVVNGQFREYPNKVDRYFEIREEMVKNISFMRNNSWIGQPTLFVVFNFEVKNVHSKYEYFFNGILQMDQRGNLLTTTPYEGFIRKAKYDDNFYLVLLIIFMINSFVYTCQILLEWNIEPNYLIAPGQMLLIISCFFFIAMEILVTIRTFQANYNLPEVYQYQLTEQSFVLILFIIYPLRFFVILSWSKNFTFLSNIFNILERSLSTFIMVSLTFFFFLYFSCHMLVQTYLQEGIVNQSSLLQSSQSLFYFDQMYSVDFQSQNSPIHQPLTYFGMTIDYLIKCFLVLYFIGFVCQLFSQSSYIEFAAHKHSFSKDVDQMYASMEVQLQKAVNLLENQLEKNKNRKATSQLSKVLVYSKLDFESREMKLLNETVFTNFNTEETNLLFDESDEVYNFISSCIGVTEEEYFQNTDSISFRHFHQIMKIFEFVQFLSTLRCEYLGQIANEYFRIALYVNSNNYFISICAKELDKFYSLLNALMASIPILFITEEEIPRDVFLNMKSVYQQVYQCRAKERAQIEAYCQLQTNWEEMKVVEEKNPMKIIDSVFNNNGIVQNSFIHSNERVSLRHIPVPDQNDDSSSNIGSFQPFEK